MSDTSTQVPAYLAIAISAGTIIVGIVNHKRIRSSCCGRITEASLDIENTTPPHLKPPPLSSVPPANP